jgi:hypothetical protein
LNKKKGNKCPHTGIIWIFLIGAVLIFHTGYAFGERVLYDFERERDLDRFEWKCFTLFSISDSHFTSGKHSLKLELYPSNYPQLLTKAEKRDLSGYEAISIDIFNSEEREIHVYVRIDDKKMVPEYGERYTGSYILKEGENRIIIPLNNLKTESGGRALDLKSIYRLFVFMKHPKKRTVLYIDNIRLVGKSDI